jgi:serine protease Do
MKSFLQFLLFVLIITVALAGLYAWKSGQSGLPRDGSAATESALPKVKPAVGTARIPGLTALNDELGRVAEAVIPSVVSISALKNPAVDPRQELIRQYFGFGRRQPIAETGSGVIVSEEGHIITNLHVIDGAAEVLVTLSGGQSLPGKVLGADPGSDIAILKIDAPGLRPLALADSEKVRVGQLVFAIGAPYGLQESVTMGIISARDRVVSSESINEFFQTDAPINPGNSGGPLVNIHGEVVAINNSIKSESGGNQGVAFSIPSNTAKRVLEQILAHGRVLRPYLGVVMLPLDAATARQLGLPDDRGALIDAVFADSPAALAGLRRGDFIVKFDGREVGGYRDLRKRVSEANVGQQAEVEILREGQTAKVSVTIVEQDQAAAGALAPSPVQVVPQLVRNGALSGVAVRSVTPQLAARYRLPDGIQGVMVQSVDRGSPAAGWLQAGDVIEQVNDDPVATPEEFAAAATALPPDQRAVLLLSRGRVRSFEVITP